jgi:cob(I)alamin adenosyltransferase
VGSHIAKPTPPQQLPSTHNATTNSNNNNNYSGYDFSHSTTILEEWIDNMTNELPELLSFIIPTGSIISAQLHVARTVCRRAERCMVPLVIANVAKSHHSRDDDDDDDNEKNECTIDPAALAYVNRLSDYFFTAARYVNYCDGIDEVQYRAIGEERRRSSVNSPKSTTTGIHRERVVVKLKK